MILNRSLEEIPMAKLDRIWPASHLDAPGIVVAINSTAPDVPTTTEKVRRRLEEPFLLCAFVHLDGEIITGYAEATRMGPAAFIDVAVRPEYRRKGIGTALVHTAQVRLRNMGRTRASCIITPWQELTGVLDFARSLGYTTLCDD